MNNYVIINADDIQSRINELKVLSTQPETSVYDVNIEGFVLDELEELLSNSIPLIPEIEKAYDEGSAYTVGSHEYFIQTHLNKKDYVLQLKFDI